LKRFGAIRKKGAGVFGDFGSVIAGVGGALLLSSPTLFGAPNLDESQLPPPATNKIDFAREIKPILDTSCIRCHGPVKPRSGFRLDSQAAALKGGDNGVDIVPGNSAKSLLVYFTAHLVEDMEMPPTGKGEPLTPSQIGLLRAWIDQGAQWGNLALANSYQVSLSPTIGGTVVRGDSHKFRELNWRQEGLDGGLADFDISEHTTNDVTLSAKGHVLKDDYKINLAVDRNDLGFIHSGWEQYRKYYDDTGGYRKTTSTPHPLSLDENLHEDIGKAWVDLGLTLPDWPRMVLGYEYDYKQGDESTTGWSSAGTGLDERNLAPASRGVREGTHIIKFDLDAEVKGITIEDQFRGEFYHLNTRYTNSAGRSLVTQEVREKNTYFQGANSIRLEKPFTDWLFTSAGYFYSHLDSDGSFTNVTRASGLSFAGTIPNITLERESHVANLNGIIGPFDGLTFSAGAQGEWTSQQGFGSGSLNQFAFTRTAPNNLVIVPTTLRSDYDQRSAMESAALRYTKIPFTVLFAEGRFEQQSIGQTDSDLQPSGNFAEKSDFSSQLTDLRTGFSTSPWQRISLSAHLRRYENDSHYPTGEAPTPADGYPDFFQSRKLLTDEAEAKLVVRPCNWLKTTLSYQLVTTEYHDFANFTSNTTTHVASPAGRLLTGKYDSRIYSFAAVLTPHPRFYFNGGFTYQPSRTTSANSDQATVGQYKGDTYSADMNGTFVLSDTTDFSFGGTFSEANYGQSRKIFVATVPVGMRYQEYGLNASVTRRFGKNLSARLQYSFDYYREPSTADANDFRAHTIFATLNLRLP
jgi:hypothetical protein